MVWGSIAIILVSDGSVAIILVNDGSVAITLVSDEGKVFFFFLFLGEEKVEEQRLNNAKFDRSNKGLIKSLYR